MCHTVHITKIALNIYWLTLFWPGAPSYPASLGTPGQGDHPNNSFSYFPFRRKWHVSGQTGSLGKPRAPFWLFSSVSTLSHFGGHTESKKKCIKNPPDLPPSVWPACKEEWKRRRRRKTNTFSKVFKHSENNSTLIHTQHTRFRRLRDWQMSIFNLPNFCY